jgi:holo-[acyl-carrier protein] synthase
VEIVDIKRFEHLLGRRPRVLQRLFTPAEISYSMNKPTPATSYASNFAAKQAVLKLLGEGFSGIRFSTVEIERDLSGAPIPVLSDKARARCDELEIIELHLSITNTHESAVASAVGLTQRARPVTDDDLTFEDRMNRAFSEARALLDEVDDGAENADEGIELSDE